QTIESHSISAGLDYPGVGPEHSFLAATGRAKYEPVTDTEAMDALRLLSRTEGIMPAIESAHGVAGARRLALQLTEADPNARPLILVNISGRGDKDVDTAIKYFGIDGSVDDVAGRMEQPASTSEAMGVEK
ncbi:MAG TPA: tryptophan synthase subunit beta, partial [Candidatus Luteococcus avicola]|nr:tryptophan synthase subunit beta [Candidatus Luteococcus avicola]